MTKQVILNRTLWIILLLYLVSLFLPYQIIGRSHIISGFEFHFPILGFIFIFPYMLLALLSETKTAHVWNIVLASLLLFVCLGTFFIAGLDIMHRTTIGLGAYLFLLVGIGFFVIAVIQSKMPANKKNDPRVLDQLL